MLHSVLVLIVLWQINTVVVVVVVVVVAVVVKREAHVHCLLSYHDAVSDGVFFIHADVHGYERRIAVPRS